MANKIFGYIRVSSKDQNVDRQVDKMLELGIDERDLFIDKSTGADFEREKYKMLLHMLRTDDVVYLDSLDRLGRNYNAVINEWKHITRDIGADIVVIEQVDLFDSRKFKEMGDIGRLLEDQFLSMMAYVADQERQKSKQRQAEGIAAAKARGKKFGRRELKITPEFLNAHQLWKNGEITAVKAMEISNTKKSTFYKWASELIVDNSNLSTD